MEPAKYLSVNEPWLPLKHVDFDSLNRNEMFADIKVHSLKFFLRVSVEKIVPIVSIEMITMYHEIKWLSYSNNFLYLKYSKWNISRCPFQEVCML